MTLARMKSRKGILIFLHLNVFDHLFDHKKLMPPYEVNVQISFFLFLNSIKNG